MLHGPLERVVRRHDFALQGYLVAASNSRRKTSSFWFSDFALMCLSSNSDLKKPSPGLLRSFAVTTDVRKGRFSSASSRSRRSNAADKGCDVHAPSIGGRLNTLTSSP